MTRIHRTSGYAPQFDLRIVDGDRAEERFTRLLSAGGETIEVKSDVRSRTSYKVAIEYEQHGVKSGIAKTTAAWWAIETYQDTFIVLPTETLKKHARRALREDGSVRMGDNGNVGVLVPVGWLVPASAFHTPLSDADEELIDRIGDEVFGRHAA